MPASARARIAEAGLLPLPEALDACAAALRERFAADHVELALFEGPHRSALTAVASDTHDAGFWAPMAGSGTASRAIDFEARPLILDGATSPDPALREAIRRGYRSGFRLPLQDERGSAMGILGVAARRPAAYTERDRAEAGELAGLIANFVRRADLLARVERRQQTAEVASAILAALSTSDDLSAACDTIARQLREFFAADHVAIGLLDFPARRRTVLGFSSDVLAPGDLPAELPEEDVRAYTLAVEQRPERFDDLRPLALNPGTAMLREAGIASIIRAPFQLADGRVGLVTVGHRAPNRFQRDDAEHLLEICRPIGLALDRVTLVAGLNTTTATLEAQARILAALSPDATLEATAHTYAREIRRLFGASHVVVTTFVPGGSRIVAIDSDHLTAEDLALTARPDRETLAQFEDLLRGRPQLVADLAATTRGPADEVAFNGGLRTLLRQPLKRSDGSIGGLITVGSERPEAYGPADLERLGEVSAAAAMVAERAELLDAARDRTAKVQSLTRLLGSLSPGADPRELSHTFAREVRQLLHADMVVVLTFDPETGEGIPIAEEAPPAPVRDWFGFRWPSYRAVTALPRASRFPGSPPAESEWLKQVVGRKGLGSGIAVRLDVEGEAFGLVIAAARERNALDAGAQQLLSELATPLAMLIERARLLEAQREQADRTAAILELLDAIGEFDTLEEVAEPVAVALSAMFGADACVIAVASNDDVQVVGHDGAAASIGARLDADAFRTARRSFRAGMRTVANLDRVRNPLTPVAVELRKHGMRSTAEALFAASGRLEVLVTLASRRPRHFTLGDGRQLAQIVRPLGLAVAYQEGRRESAARARRLELTNQVLRRLTAGGRPREMARELTLACLDLFGAAMAFVGWADPAADGLQVLAVSSRIPDIPEPPSSVPFGEGVSRWFLHMQKPHIVEDAATDSFQSVVHRVLVPRGYRSVLRAPLLVRDEVQGAIVLWGEGTGRFSGEDLHLLSALAGPLAIALDNAVALEALAESELKYRSLVTQADEMIFLVDATTQRLIEVNAYTARTLGYEPAEMMSLNLTDIVDAPPESVAANIARTCEDGELHLTERRYRRRDGSAIEVDVVASVVTFGGRDAILVLARDVSGRLALQRQLLQSQKMESLGAMAGNVAHDFNNLLTAVLGFAGILKLSPRMSHEDLDTIALIEAAAQRAGDLSGRLLSFARGGLVSFGPVDLRQTIIDTIELAGPTLHGRLRVESRLPDAPLFIEGDAGQVQQALFNILLNARDAMPSGGTISIGLRRDGAEAILTVRDTGCGMDEETRLRIFEPFFTTKPAGTGTGLGMSITYGIVQAHHGTIAVESAPGAGTCFELRLPVLTGGH